MYNQQKRDRTVKYYIRRLSNGSFITQKIEKVLKTINFPKNHYTDLNIGKGNNVDLKTLY